MNYLRRHSQEFSIINKFLDISTIEDSLENDNSKA